MWPTRIGSPISLVVLWTQPGMVFEHRVRCKFWDLLGVNSKQTKIKTQKRQIFSLQNNEVIHSFINSILFVLVALIFKSSISYMQRLCSIPYQVPDMVDPFIGEERSYHPADKGFLGLLISVRIRLKSILYNLISSRCSPHQTTSAKAAPSPIQTSHSWISIDLEYSE